MRTATYQDFLNALHGPDGKWYQGRWSYYEPVISILNVIAPVTVLEIGPGQFPIMHGEDALVFPEEDQWGYPESALCKIYKHDITLCPWPFVDKQFDVVIALQVWEHLNGKQTRCFRELKRIGKKAILTFPYEWDVPRNHPNFRDHYMIDLALIDDWTLQQQYARQVCIPAQPDKRYEGKRILRYYDFGLG